MLDHILHTQWVIFYDIQTVQIEVALDSWFPGLKFCHYAGAWMTVLLTIRPSPIHDSKWHLFQFLNLLSLTQKFGVRRFFCWIYPLVVHNFKQWYTYCRQLQQILLVLSTYSTCLGHSDHLQALNMWYLKLKIKCTYSEFVRSHKFYKSY